MESEEMEPLNGMLRMVKTECSADYDIDLSKEPNPMIGRRIIDGTTHHRDYNEQCTFDGDIEVEETKVISPVEENSFSCADMDIKIENFPGCENFRSAEVDELVKIESLPMLPCELPPTSAKGGDINESTDNSSEKLHENVYADGIVYEVREINEREHTANVSEDYASESHGKDNVDPPESNEPSSNNDNSMHSNDSSESQEKPYQCNKCEKSFLLRIELKIHRRNHQFTDCPVCKKSMRKDFVKRHIARVHPNDNILPTNQQYPCDECERTFPNKVLLVSHQQIHKKQDCPVCKKTFRADYLRRHMDLNHPHDAELYDEDVQYPCDQCDTICNNKYQLFFHKRTHQTEVCPICKESFRTNYLKVHIAMQHPTECAVPENRPYQCEQCNESFTYKTALIVHQRKHRMTECPLCKKTFRFDCLKRHMDFNHSSVATDDDQKVLQHTDEISVPNEETAYRCNQCEASFSKKTQLLAHKRSHRTVDCPICKETFRTNYLKVHIAMKHPDDHTVPANRAFSCDQCEKSFTYKTELRLHMRKHQLTECPVCKRSLRSDCVKMHIARKHPNSSADFTVLCNGEKS